MLLALWLLAAVPDVPTTPKQSVTDEYFGTKVVDDYRWLEDGADAKVQAWSDAQNAHARAVLDALPGRAALKPQVEAVMNHPSPEWSNVVVRGGLVFALKSQPPRQQPLLVVVEQFEGTLKERVVCDPLVLDATGGLSIDLYEPSLDGKKVVVALSKSGSERADAYVFDSATGAKLADVVPAVHTGTALGTVAWNANGTGFFYTRHPLEGERPAADLGSYQQVWFHTLGTPTKADTYSLGKDFERIAENALASNEDGSWYLDLKAKGDGGEYELWLLPPGGKWIQVSRYEDQVVAASFGFDGALYLTSRKDAPRGKVLRLSLAGTPTLDKATVLVPQGKFAVDGLVATSTRLYVREQVGGPSQLHAWGLDGKDLGLVATPPVSTVGELVRLSGDDVLVGLTGYLMPPALFHLSAKSGELKPTLLSATTSLDLAGLEVVRDTCTSKDGTAVPISIVRTKGLTLNGKVPTALVGYGGYGISQSPAFMAMEALWVRLGGVVAVANLRGGGEFGEQWHRDGMLTKKQNVFDDLYACTQRLAQLKYATAQHLVIEGGSNGGLLMGALLTQHPDAVKAVVSFVGIYDALRAETTPNGMFNTTEFGTVKDEAQFKALAAYSPLHAVKRGTKYPATLLLTGANDPRVDPFHSRKFAAALQASGTKQPVLLRTSGDTGHGMGTPLNEQVAEWVDVLAFAADQVGLKVPAPKPAH